MLQAGGNCNQQPERARAHPADRNAESAASNDPPTDTRIVPRVRIQSGARGPNQLTLDTRWLAIHLPSGPGLKSPSA